MNYERGLFLKNARSASASVLDTLNGSPATYGLIDDPINHVMYGTTTDFFSTGDLHVIAYDGTIVSSAPVGVSPGRLALDVRASTGIAETAPAALRIHPNPAPRALRLLQARG